MKCKLKIKEAVVVVQLVPGLPRPGDDRNKIQREMRKIKLDCTSGSSCVTSQSGRAIKVSGRDI